MDLSNLSFIPCAMVARICDLYLWIEGLIWNTISFFLNPLKLHCIAVESVQNIEKHTQRTHSYPLYQTYNYTPPNQPRPQRDHQKTLVRDEDVALLLWHHA
jgi:hypothetical protein